MPARHHSMGSHSRVQQRSSRVSFRLCGLQLNPPCPSPRQKATQQPNKQARAYAPDRRDDDARRGEDTRSHLHTDDQRHAYSQRYHGVKHYSQCSSVTCLWSCCTTSSSPLSDNGKRACSNSNPVMLDIVPDRSRRGGAPRPLVIPCSSSSARRVAVGLSSMLELGERTRDGGVGGEVDLSIALRWGGRGRWRWGRVRVRCGLLGGYASVLSRCPLCFWARYVV